MPELSRFFGIIMRMYMETGGPHHVPHFHAYYMDDIAVIGLDPIELLAGSLPWRQLRFAEAWAELHQDELIVTGKFSRTAKPRDQLSPWSDA